MELPNEFEVRKLLENVHTNGVPNWTSNDIENAYIQLENLYEHWFRKSKPNNSLDFVF